MRSRLHQLSAAHDVNRRQSAPSGADAGVSRAPTACEVSEPDGALAIEIIVLWGGDVLSVSHFSLLATVFAGESASSCDVLLPAEQLGAERLRIAVGRRGQVHAVLPARAVGWLTLATGTTLAFEARSHALPGSEHLTEGERLVHLAPGSRAHLCFEDIEVQIAPVRLERAPVRRWSDLIDVGMLGYFSITLFLVGGLLSFLEAMDAPPGLNRGEAAAADRLHRMQGYLEASRQHAPTHASRERLEEGPAAAALVSPAWPSSGHTQREVEAALSAVEEVSSPEPVVDAAVGTARSASKSHADAERVRSPEGVAQNRAGSGEGDASSVPMHGVRTIANGEGRWPEHIPHHLGRITGSRRGEISVWGSIPEAAIQRTIAEHARSVRRCYEEGLERDPMLNGRAMMRFLIQRDGHVQRVNTLGSDLASRDVLRCLEKVLHGIRFPRPDSGTVMVTYPLVLSP